MAALAGVRVALVGPAAVIRDALTSAGAPADAVTIVDAPDGVSMDEPPLAALRRKPRASIRVACELAASGDAAAVYTAGHTGAALLAAHGAFGLLPHVERPALAVIVPTRRGRSVLVDAGANVDCRPAHLVQFGIMGAALARVLLGVASPRVGLLSIGEEPGKGNDVTKEAHALLAAAPVQSIGNVDASQWLSGVADVVVCDGFVGNIALKVGESVVAMVQDALGGAANPAVDAATFERFDYVNAGGAPLIGVNGLIVVGHGRSSARAIANGIALTAQLAADGIVAQVAEAVQRVLK